MQELFIRDGGGMGDGGARPSGSRDIAKKLEKQADFEWKPYEYDYKMSCFWGWVGGSGRPADLAPPPHLLKIENKHFLFLT